MARPKTSIKVRHEPTRIAGKKADAEGVVEVRDPWADTVIGTVPAGGAEHARERQKILLRTAELLNARKEEISDLVTRSWHLQAGLNLDQLETSF